MKDPVDRALSAVLTFMGIFFALIAALAITETYGHLRIKPFGSRMAIVWIMLISAFAVAILQWFRHSKRGRSTGAPPTTLIPEARLRRILSSIPTGEIITMAHFLSNPEAIDMSEEADVAWVRAQRDPELWHEATVAALAYRDDHYGFLRWVLLQPETDRATAGWIFLWAEGSRYLRGETDFPLNHLTSDEMLDLFRAICERSEGLGFASDSLGLDRDFEEERVACLAIIEDGEVASGITPPVALLRKPFKPPHKQSRFMLNDGIILVGSANIAKA